MQHEKMNAADTGGISIGREGLLLEQAEAHGRYSVQCFDKDGNLKWDDTFDNVVTTVGKNLALDSFLAGSAYTVVGPYLGLINGSASSAALADTMGSHAAWSEVGNANGPQVKYPNSGGSQVRATVSWSAAASGQKTMSAAASFYISGVTGGTTIGGCFLVFGSGAVNTIDSTAGVLYSAGAFTGGSKTVAIGDTINVTYTASL